MKKLCLIFALLTLGVSSAYAVEEIPQCRGWTQPTECLSTGLALRFESFSTGIRTATQSLGVTDKVDIIVVRDRGNYTAEAFTVAMPKLGSQFNTLPPYIVYVTLKFLEDRSTYASLLHVAFHEVCHIKNGDPGRSSSSMSAGTDDRKEILAEKCAYKHMNGSDFLAAYRREIEITSPDSDLLKLSDAQWHDAFRKIFAD
jgi:hypothetical protein